MPTDSLSAALRLRYGVQDQPADPIGSATLDLLLAHRSVRAYRPEPLPDGTLAAMLAAAQSASTSSNLQAWSVVAVEDPERKARLARFAGDQEHVSACPLLLIWLADLARLERIAVQQALPYAALDYTEMLLLGVIDAALAAQNAAVAAESLGLGVVYIGAMRNQPLEVAAELHLPARVFAAFGMCVGWPDPAHPAAVKPRLPQSVVLHRETYSTAREEQAVARYGEAMGQFYAEQAMRVQGDWARHSAKRIAGPQSLAGRDQLREALIRLGFELR